MTAGPLGGHDALLATAANERLDAVNGTQPVSDWLEGRCRGEDGVTDDGAGTRSAAQRAGDK